MKAMFVKYDGIPFQEIQKGLRVKPFVVDKLCATIVKWDKGTVFGPHEHADAQIDFLLKGKMEWTVEDDRGERKEIFSEGMVCGLDPYVYHTGIALEDSMGVEIFCPPDRHVELARKLGLLVSEVK